MTLTIEMPATDLSTSPPFDPNPLADNAAITAQAAADLLEQGEAEAEVIDGSFTVDPPFPVEMAQPAAESNGEQQKKKRTRKPKAAPIPLSAPPANIPIDTPEVSATLAAPFRISRSTRQFQIAKVESEYIEVTLTINANEALIEDAKAAVKQLSERQRALAIELTHLRKDEQWQPELPLSESPPAAAVDGSISQATTDKAEPNHVKEVAAPVNLIQNLTAPASGDDEGWRAVKVCALGLPPKLAEKLTDGYPSMTLGLLEDLRAEISQGRAKWPKGIGAAKITLIEDAVVRWLAAWHSKAVTIAANEVSQPVVTQVGMDGEDGSRGSSPPAAVSSVASTTEDAAILSRATAINDGSLNCLARKHPDGDKFYTSGFESYGRLVDGQACKLTDCPYVPGPEQDDWLRGWMAARVVDGYTDAPAAPAPPAPPAPAAATATAVDLCSLDDV